MDLYKFQASLVCVGSTRPGRDTDGSTCVSIPSAQCFRGRGEGTGQEQCRGQAEAAGSSERLCLRGARWRLIDQHTQRPPLASINAITGVCVHVNCTQHKLNVKKCSLC